MTIAENIKRIRARSGLTQEEFGKVADVSAMAVSQWENGRAVPRMGAVERIAKHFGIPMGEVIDENNYSLEPRPISAGAPAYLPMMRLGAVHAGEPIEEIPDEDVVMVPAHVKEAHPDAFVYKVRGDCMDRVVPDGYDVVADPSVPPTRGSIVVAEITPGEALMRRWYKGTDTLMLCADSHSYHEDIVLRDEDSEVFVRGVVVWSQKEIEG